MVAAGPASHYVSLIYDHWAADSIGARLVMRHVLGRYLDLDIPENEEPLDLYPGTYREVFAHRLQGHRLAWPMLRSIQSWIKNRSTSRVAYSSAQQMAVGYSLYRVRPGTVQHVHQFARDIGASVHDVFLAALCRALAPFLPKRLSKAGSRHDVGHHRRYPARRERGLERSRWARFSDTICCVSPATGRSAWTN